MNEMKQFYEKNEVFRNYVDNMRKHRNKSVDEVLAMYIVKEYYKYLTERS